MATISPLGKWLAKGVHQATWSALTGSGDSAVAYGAPHLGDKTVTVNAETATGFNSVVVTLVGSNDETATGTYQSLNDAQGNVLTFSSGRIETLLENPKWIKPIATGATGGSQSFSVILISRSDPR